MKLSTKTRYGTRAMLYLTLYDERAPISTKDIAEQEDVSPKYLEQLLRTLEMSGLARATRGAKGGYALARPADQITVYDIYQALEGSDAFVPCITDPSLCNRSEHCITRGVWDRMYQASMEVLSGTTLQDLAEEAEQSHHVEGMYYI